MRKLIVAFVMLFSVFALAETVVSDKLYMPVDGGGYIVLSVAECEKSYKDEYPFKAHAENDDGSIALEGCWTRPEERPGMTPRILVRLDDGELGSFGDKLFSPVRKRWTNTNNPYREGYNPF